MTRISVIYREHQEALAVRRLLKQDPTPYMW